MVSHLSVQEGLIAALNFSFSRNGAVVTPSIVSKLKRVLKMSPRSLGRRVSLEAGQAFDRLFRVSHASGINLRQLLKATRTSSLDDLWQQLSHLPYFTSTTDPSELNSVPHNEKGRVLQQADNALARKVLLFGSGELELGNRINWHLDYKSGVRWPVKHSFDTQLIQTANNSDVKFPWELSRLQWLIPVGQAYAFTRDELYAEDTRRVLEDWIVQNPYMIGVNWTCAMEAALRVFSWTWLFHVFKDSVAWSDSCFREQFLCHLFAHGQFISRYFEYSDVNGNHCTADAAGLVFAGLFFGQGSKPNGWQRRGWRLLQEELPTQVHEDGVDFEGSIAYHRLVLELFLLPTLYRKARGLAVPQAYQDRLKQMARFTAAYVRDDGSSPNWGDADDARALPFGSQSLGDHRYLLGLVGVAFNDDDLCRSFSGPLNEILWTLGENAARRLQRSLAGNQPRSQSFPHGGYYVMRNARDHVFIDCATVGTAGRGGHGHNDCLSFEAVLDGELLFIDCGTYAYTASTVERNRFRSTDYHNTPRVDGEEINRLYDPNNLWNLHNDAQPQVWRWVTGMDRDVLEASHSGFERLQQPVTPVRTFVLDHQDHWLEIHDRFEGEGIHLVEIPLHPAPHVSVRQIDASVVTLKSGERDFKLSWQLAANWEFEIEEARISPSYGTVKPTKRLLWRCYGELSTLQLRVQACTLRLQTPSENHVSVYSYS